jgi:hypothetical protein
LARNSIYSEDTCDLHAVKPIMHILRWSQIPHRGFKRSMSHSTLNRADIEAATKHPSRER